VFTDKMDKISLLVPHYRQYYPTQRKYDTSVIIDILVSASKPSLQELVNYLQSFLIEKKSKLDGKIF